MISNQRVGCPRAVFARRALSLTAGVHIRLSTLSLVPHASRSLLSLTFTLPIIGHSRGEQVSRGLNVPSSPQRAVVTPSGRSPASHMNCTSSPQSGATPAPAPPAGDTSVPSRTSGTAHRTPGEGKICALHYRSHSRPKLSLIDVRSVPARAPHAREGKCFIIAHNVTGSGGRRIAPGICLVCALHCRKE